MSGAESMRVRADAVTWRFVEDEVVILDRRTWGYLSINDSGAVLWQRLVDGATTPELAAALVEDFDVEEATALSDAEAFVAALRERDLLVEPVAP
jgi:hypothetical protein